MSLKQEMKSLPFQGVEQHLLRVGHIPTARCQKSLQCQIRAELVERQVCLQGADQDWGHSSESRMKEGT